MAKLSKEEIQFVDNYLYNSGVQYVDIRYEMLDHVVTALEEMEGCFSENLKRYMIAHKAELLKSNTHFKRIAVKGAWKVFLGNLIKLQFFYLVVIIFLLAFWLQSKFGYEQVSNGFLMLHVAISLLAYVGWVYFWMVSKNKYSITDKLMLICYFFPIFLRFERVSDNEIVLLVCNTIYTSFMILVAYTVIQLNRKYKLRYNG